MKNVIIIFVVIFISFSCSEKKKDDFKLDYIKNKNNIYLNYENNTNKDIIFLAPNILDFGDENFKDFNTRGNMEGFFPIAVYAIIEPNQSYQFYQKKLDSIRNKDLLERGINDDLFKEVKPGEGNSVFYLKKNEKIKVKYNLTIKPLTLKRTYSSKFKQNYYPYDKLKQENARYSEARNLRNFSKLNFGKAKFVLQPVIEDSLFLRISDKDATN
ncbi:hypothetical protein PFY10_20015 [Chryseobacterium daecheongense]|nr:hypothetical protein PFY10_20015 [Chryseobacterium daecheongense]